MPQGTGVRPPPARPSLGEGWRAAGWVWVTNFPESEGDSMAYAKGCIPPKDLANRARLSYQRHGVRLGLLPTATEPAFDWRTLGKVTPIKDQGNCGSCWDFSGTGCAEMAAVVAGISIADATSWAEQSVLDCCQNNGGCNGDWPETALGFAKNSGLANT